MPSPVSPSPADRELQLRILAAVPRSGSTLFMRAFLDIPRYAVTNRLVMVENCNVAQGIFNPNQSIFTVPLRYEVYREALGRGSNVLVSEKELGREAWKAEPDYAIIHDASGHDLEKPAFLFRDPVRVFDSWKSMGWGDVSSFSACYRHLFEVWSKHPCFQAYVYEDLVRNPSETMQKLCTYWDVPYTEDMLVFRRPLNNCLLANDRERHHYTTESADGLLDSVKSPHTIVSDIKSHQLLSNLEIEIIEEGLASRYLQSCGSRVQSLRDILFEHKWYGFDLDDTLHEFRKASRRASESVIQQVAKLSDVPIDDLSSTYSKILAQKTASAFTEGESSDYYRNERFRALLQAHGIPYDTERLGSLVALYQSKLESALERKPGALSLLRYLRRMGKKVAVVTEGPQDAQEWTLEQLELAPHVDVLVTTNKFGKSKIDGLFPAVIAHLGIESRDMVYVGDNYQRDIIPAQAAGIRAIHLSETENVILEPVDTRVNSLLKLEYILRYPEEPL